MTSTSTRLPNDHHQPKTMKSRSLIIHRQIELREVGRIRIGEKKTSAEGKEYPAGRDTFRFTSANRALLEVLQAELGGELRPFAGFPGQWDLSSAASQIKVYVSADNVSQSYEQWSGGGCTHRCDGRTCHRVIVKKTGAKDAKGKDVFEVTEHDVNCLCDPEGLEDGLPDRDRECTLKTRLRVMIPATRDIGLWRLESGGSIFAGETMAMLGEFERMRLGPVACLLTLGWQEIKKPGKPASRFIVPSLSVDPNPPAFAATMVQSTLAHQIRQELARPSAPALESGRAEPVEAQVVDDEPAPPARAATKKEEPRLPLPEDWSSTHDEARRQAKEIEAELHWSTDKSNFAAIKIEAERQGLYWPALVCLAREIGAVGTCAEALAWIKAYGAENGAAAASPASADPFVTVPAQPELGA